MTRIATKGHLQIKGYIKLIAADPKTGRVVATREVKNLLVTVGLRLVGDVLIDAEATGLTYIAIGTGNTAPALTDTKLVTESSRKINTSRSRTGDVITINAFFTAAQSTYNIKEVGVFGGAAASASADSGVLFDRALLSYENSAGSNDLTFEAKFTIQEV